MKKVILVFVIIVSQLVAQDISDLLSSYAQEADLSSRTKEENSGSVIVLKRSDMDRLRIRTLAELIDLTPFVNYKEDYLGFGSMYSSPYEGDEQNMIRIFLDDRELYFSYFGGSLSLFSRMNIDFIDHAEIYFGLTSFEFGIEPGVIVFKLYTKEPSRENTSLLSVSGSTRNAKEAYAYSAMAYDDFSYLVSVSLNDMRLDNDKNEHLKIDRDFQTLNFFTKLYYKNHEFQLHALYSDYKNLVKGTPLVPPSKNLSDMYYTFMAYKYVSDDDFKIYLDHSITKAKNKVFLSLDPRNLLDNAFGKYSSVLDEVNTDFQISQKFSFKDLNVNVGYKARYKSFKMKNDTEYIDYANSDNNSGTKPTEFISSIFADSDYHLNENDILNLSLKYDIIKRSKGLQGDKTFGVRVGYVHNADDWYFKLFGSFSQVSDSPYPFVPSYYPKNPKKEKVSYVSTEVGLKGEKSQTSLMLAKLLYKKNSFSVQTSQDDANSLNTYLTNNYQINSKHNLNTILWYSQMSFKMPNINIKDSYYGGFLSMQSKFDKVDLVNTLIYKDGDLENAPGYNYNLALHYDYSKNLTFYIKGLNLLNKDLKYRYQIYTRNSPEPQYFDISTYDRTFWFGLEYQF